MALLLLAFIVLPIAEIYVIIQVGEAIGALPTVALLIVDSFIGAALLRSQGRVVWRRFNEALAAGRVPAREVLDGAMVLLGGAFLITPGFISDVVGLSLLIPPSRAMFRRGVAGMARRRVTFGVYGPAGRASTPGSGFDGGARRASRPYDVEGTAHEVDEPPERLPEGDEGGH